MCYALSECELSWLLHNFLNFVALSNFCLLSISSPSPCFAIHLHKLTRYFTVSIFPLAFNMSFECQVLHVLFPHYASQNFQQSLSDSKCPFFFIFSETFLHCWHVPSMALPKSFCRNLYFLVLVGNQSRRSTTLNSKLVRQLHFIETDLL